MLSALSLYCKISSVILSDVKNLTCVSITGIEIDTQALSKYSSNVGVCPAWYHCASNKYDLHRSAHCNFYHSEKSIFGFISVFHKFTASVITKETSKFVIVKDDGWITAFFRYGRMRNPVFVNVLYVISLTVL